MFKAVAVHELHHAFISFQYALDKLVASRNPKL